MREAREFYRDGDALGPCLLPAGLAQFLAWLLPTSERVEWLCLEVFGAGSPRESLQARAIDAPLNQILKGVSSLLGALLAGDAQSPWLLAAEAALLDRCLAHGGILLRSSVLWRLLRSQRDALAAEWTAFARETRRRVRDFAVEPRYCGVLRPVRVLPGIADRIVETEKLRGAVCARLEAALAKQGPANGEIRRVHEELNKAMPPPAGSAQDEEAACDGMALLVELGREIRSKVEEIAGMAPKYTQLIRMENLQFLATTMELRVIDALSDQVETWKSGYQEVG